MATQSAVVWLSLPLSCKAFEICSAVSPLPAPGAVVTPPGPVVTPPGPVTPGAVVGTPDTVEAAAPEVAVTAPAAVGVGVAAS
ncbi:hypothetical protein GCM10010198_19470 [Nocardia seriolae]|nr:hypothetical protein NSERKGN1266_77520 [Nocardia seriolae]BEK99288.1 hypothetical protein NSER024013_71940 [Nocardia seriolae]